MGGDQLSGGKETFVTGLCAGGFKHQFTRLKRRHFDSRYVTRLVTEQVRDR